MTDRISRTANWSYHQFVLATGEVAYKNYLACLDTATGTVRVGQTSTTLVPIGKFAEALTGDGVKLINVQLFSEVVADWWDNDSGTAAASTDVGSECYVKDGFTVTMDSTGRSKAGRIMAVDATKGVLVAAGLAVTGPTGASTSTGSHVATVAVMSAVTAANRSNGKRVMVDADRSLWVFAASSTATDTSKQLVVAPDAGSGAWIRADQSFTMSLPITYASADAAVLHTVPTGFVLKLAGAPYWDVATGFSGGSSSSIGLSSSRSGYSTKGDLISATLAAALTAGVRAGTIGDKVDTVAELQALFLEATDTIRHDRIVSAYTAGAANVRVPVIVVTAPAIA